LVAAAKRFTQEFSIVRGLCTYSETIKQTDTYNCGSGTSEVSFSINSPLKVLSPAPIANKANRKLLAKALVNEDAVLLIMLNNNMRSSSAISDQSGTIEITIPEWIPIEDIWEVTPNGKIPVNDYTINERTLTFDVNIGTNWPAKCYVIGKTDLTAPETPLTPIMVENGNNSIILSWKDVFDNYGVEGYNVYYNDSKIATVNVPYFEINDLNNYPANEKKFSIKAFDANNNISEASPYAVINDGTVLNNQNESNSPFLVLDQINQKVNILNVNKVSVINVYDILGRSYKSNIKADSDNSFDISMFTKGFYLVYVKHATGEYTQKMIF
jgi:hypothetical protein